jgi:FKBP-type peptidyl-prolyl cis-trans isomerase
MKTHEAGAKRPPRVSNTRSLSEAFVVSYRGALINGKEFDRSYKSDQGSR